jgi:hypothetical protein
MAGGQGPRRTPAVGKPPNNNAKLLYVALCSFKPLLHLRIRDLVLLLKLQVLLLDAPFRAPVEDEEEQNGAEHDEGAVDGGQLKTLCGQCKGQGVGESKVPARLGFRV